MSSISVIESMGWLIKQLAKLDIHLQMDEFGIITNHVIGEMIWLKEKENSQ